MTKTNRTSNFDSQTIVRGITAGLVVGIIELTLAISLASLVFSGDLAPFFSRGIGLFLFGSVSMGLVVAALGSLPGTAIGPQDGPAALLAVGASGVASALAGTLHPEALYFTVVAAILLSSLATGLVFFLIVYFKLGYLVRFIPCPVIVGFLAGTGWLHLRGALEVLGQVFGLECKVIH